MHQSTSSRPPRATSPAALMGVPFSIPLKLRDVRSCIDIHTTGCASTSTDRGPPHNDESPASAGVGPNKTEASASATTSAKNGGAAGDKEQDGPSRSTSEDAKNSIAMNMTEQCEAGTRTSRGGDAPVSCQHEQGAAATLNVGVTLEVPLSEKLVDMLLQYRQLLAADQAGRGGGGGAAARAATNWKNHHVGAAAAYGSQRPAPRPTLGRPGVVASTTAAMTTVPGSTQQQPSSRPGSQTSGQQVGQQQSVMKKHIRSAHVGGSEHTVGRSVSRGASDPVRE
ncbi:unnamed protein product [Amoebophrya sp. A120]|nr:unnamed protein product [Amoebophrya sp. A120]|eukprot:GSA120T00017938001.1